MKREVVLLHEFVEYIPSDLSENTIYVSIPFATAVHKCVCGCGKEVVTPLTPTDWKLIFDGETISLDPSIGNWSFDCRSHYWIKQNRARWAHQWSKEEIECGRAYDRLAKDELFSRATNPSEVAAALTKPSFWSRLKSRLQNRSS